MKEAGNKAHQVVLKSVSENPRKATMLLYGASKRIPKEQATYRKNGKSLATQNNKFSKVRNDNDNF
jgi:hypothetical protein